MKNNEEILKDIVSKLEDFWKNTEYDFNEISDEDYGKNVKKFAENSLRQAYPGINFECVIKSIRDSVINMDIESSVTRYIVNINK